MASESLQGIVERLWAGSAGPAETTEQLTRQLAELTSVARVQSESTEDNTRAVIENSLVRSSGGALSKAGDIGRSLLSFLGGGLGLAPLLGRLFGGGKDEAPAVLPSYTLPRPIHVDAGLVSPAPLEIGPVRYGQDGLPRPVQPGRPLEGPSVTVQVQAIDSRSFLDHSSEIAQAVREALLSAHSLNDVVNEI